MSLRDMKDRIKIFDIAALTIAIIVIFVITFAVYQKKSTHTLVHIKTETGEWIFPLTEERRFYGEGRSGICNILIRDGTVRVVASDCPEKICQKKGAISLPGQWIACLPNKVFISIQSQNKRMVDAISF